MAAAFQHGRHASRLRSDSCGVSDRAQIEIGAELGGDLQSDPRAQARMRDFFEHADDEAISQQRTRLCFRHAARTRSEEQPSELPTLMRNSLSVLWLKKKQYK